MPREIVITRNPFKKTFKWAVFSIILAILAIGVWIGYSANKALRKITTDSNNKSSIFSFFSDFSSGSLKGKKDGRTNILLLGMGGKNHPGAMLTDTIIVASINWQDNKIGLVSVPRDLWVPIPGFGHAKINEAYTKGEENKKTTGGGGSLSSRTIENVLGIPIHYYTSLDFEGFKKIVDTLGGIDIYVEKEIYDPYYPAPNMIDYQPFRISAGLHHMNGDLALRYARSRKTTSDFDRSRRQMQVMAAIREKVLTLGILANPKKITDLINILGDHLRMNLSVAEIRTLWDNSQNLDTTNIINKVLDTSADGLLIASQDNRGYFVYPRKGIDKFSEIQKMARNLFSQTAEDIYLVKIEVLNGVGKKGVASTVGQYLESYGFNISRIGNASETYAKTVVHDCSGGKYRQTAEKIAALLQAGHDSKNSSCNNIPIQVIVGQDYLDNQ